MSWAAYDDLVAISTELGAAPSNLQTDVAHLILTEDDWSAIGTGYYAVEDAFPGAFAVYWLSRAGFDQCRRHAFLYYELWCGSLCEEGTYVVLAFDGSKWAVEAEVPIWASR
jgi:hypothetical protein